VFQGSSGLTLDAKGRVAIPTRHRDVLLSNEQGRLTLTRHQAGCLLLYPRSVWDKKREDIKALPAAAEPLKRLVLGNAQDVDMDGSGRILIAPELRQKAGMVRDVMMLGMGGYFELWDADRLTQREAEDLAALPPEVLSQFSF